MVVPEVRVDGVGFRRAGIAMVASGVAQIDVWNGVVEVGRALAVAMAVDLLAASFAVRSSWAAADIAASGVASFVPYAGG